MKNKIKNYNINRDIDFWTFRYIKVRALNKLLNRRNDILKKKLKEARDMNILLSYGYDKRCKLKNQLNDL